MDLSYNMLYPKSATSKKSAANPQRVVLQNHVKTEVPITNLHTSRCTSCCQTKFKSTTNQCLLEFGLNYLKTECNEIGLSVAKERQIFQKKQYNRKP